MCYYDLVVSPESRLNPKSPERCNELHKNPKKSMMCKEKPYNASARPKTSAPSTTAAGAPTEPAPPVAGIMGLVAAGVVAAADVGYVLPTAAAAGVVGVALAEAGAGPTTKLGLGVAPAELVLKPTCGTVAIVLTIIVVLELGMALPADAPVEYVHGTVTVAETETVVTGALGSGAHVMLGGMAVSGAGLCTRWFAQMPAKQEKAEVLVASSGEYASMQCITCIVNSGLMQ